MEAKKKRGRPKLPKAKKLTQIVIAVPYKNIGAARAECLAIQVKYR